MAGFIIGELISMARLIKIGFSASGRWDSVQNCDGNPF